eukprot:c23836_g1_i1 orf=20-1840(-)
MMSSFGAYPSSSALSSSLFFITSTKPLSAPHPFFHHRPLLSAHGGSEIQSIHGALGSFSTDYSTLSNRYAGYGSCGRNSTACNFHGSFSPEALTGCNSYGNLSSESSFEGFLHSESIYSGLGSLSRDSSAACNSYGGKGSYYRVTSSDSSRYHNTGSYGGESAAVGRIYGDAESLVRDVSDSSGNSASFDREPLSLSSSQGSPRSFTREFPGHRQSDHLHVSNGYGVSQSFSGESSSGMYASHGSFGRDTSAASPFQNATVSVFWDLDNKPPKSSPYHAALYLRHAASQFGSVIEMVAYANRHAFTHVPEWVREERRDRKQLDRLEQRGLVQLEQPYVCSLCGRKCKTNILLKKHFKQLHEREHNKRMSRLNSLKGKKRTKFKEAVLPKTEKYREAARPILLPKVGYGLESDLRRAGVFVSTVQFKPQAADIALKKQMAESMNKGIKCLCLVSDDTDFAQMLADARALNHRTVVFGESKSLKRYADFWFPWADISQGIPRQDIQNAIRAWTRPQDHELLAGSRNFSSGYGIYNEDSEVQHKFFGGSSPVQKAGLSVFSDEEQAEEPDEDVYGSLSDDDMELSFEDVDDEIDGDWEDDADDGSIEVY